MAEIIFYEKPGCINNTKQKEWLVAAGHDVKAVNLLKHSWTIESLKQFFGNKPIADCFNKTTPAIKSGEVDPDSFSKEAALKKMIEEPILIKRPLLIIGQRTFLQGFDKEEIQGIISLAPKEGAEAEVKELEKTDLTICPKLPTNSSCDQEVEVNKTHTGVIELTPIMELIEQMGHNITYAYEDLVFVDHSAFLFQFLNNKKIALYFNIECTDHDAQIIEEQVLSIGKTKKLTIIRKGKFAISQEEDEETLELEFFDEPE